jgi:hypothetical protein
MILWHGTTVMRAEAILRDGPDPDYVEPFSDDPAGGFSAPPPKSAYTAGSPEAIARGKAKEFVQDGGVAIVEVNVPEWIVNITDPLGVEVRFSLGYGLEELPQ